MRPKALYLWIAATLLAGGIAPGPARADFWGQWRFDGANTGFNRNESLLIPIPNLFWFSADATADFPAGGAIKAYGPVVADVKRDTDVVPDHLVFVARQNRLYAYRPLTQGTGTTGAQQPLQGWPISLQSVGEGNAPDDTASGIIQAPPIYAKVSGFDGTAVVTRHVVFLLTGAGTGTDFLMLHAYALPATFPGATAPEHLWTRKISGVQGASVPLAGATFADIGDTAISLPLIFLTTREGRLHAINARPFDANASGAAGSPKPGRDRWIYTGAIPQGGGARPTFAAGPAVGRAALTGFSATVGPKVAAKNREWLVTAVDSSGTVLAFEAFGKSTAINLDVNGKPANTDAASGVKSPLDEGSLLRWKYLLDEATPGTPDTVSVPPLIWDGATPIIDPVQNKAQTADQGHDDLVVIGTRSGKVYALDFIGNFYGKAPGGNSTAQVGDATGDTFRRWKYPEEDLPTKADDETDPPTFTPRALVSPLAAWAGVTAADAAGGAALNTSPDDDVLFLRYDVPTNDTGTPVQEFLGSVDLYPRVETRQPINTAVTPKLFVLRLPAGGGPVTGIPVPAANIAVVPQFKDTSSDVDANNDGVPDNQPTRGRLVVIRQTWLDENGDPQDLKIGDIVRVTYRPVGSNTDVTEDNLRFPVRRRQVAEATNNSAAGDPVRMSLGNKEILVQDVAAEVITPPATGLLPAPAMAVANNTIWLGSRYRGRFYDLQADSLLNAGGLISSDDKGTDLPPEDDQAGIPDPVGAPALADGWLYVVYDQGLLVAYANDGGLTPGTGLGPYTGANSPFQRRFPLGNTLEKPRILLVDANGNPITDEDRLLFDWGETITIKVNFDNRLGDRRGLSRNPVRATLRGPMGDLPPVTASPVRPANAQNDDARQVTLELTIPNASSQNPMTPGTKLLKDITAPPDRSREPHWELRVEQIGTNWRGTQGLAATDPAYVPDGPWVPNTQRQDWNGNTGSAPWISLNNPIALRYGPINGVAPLDIGYVARFATDGFARRDERFNGDPYKGNVLNAPGGAQFDEPRVLVVGTDPRNGRQMLFADHGKTSPSMTMEIADRSDLGVNGTQGPLRVKVQVSKLTKLGAGRALATGGTVGQMPGSINQNANFPDDGPDGYYASIPGDRLKVVKIGDGSDATDASVPLRGAVTQRDATTNRPLIGTDGRAQKTLQTDGFSVSVDVPRYQADDIYETRARVPQLVAGQPVFTQSSAVDPRQPFSDFIGQTGQPSNAPPPQDAKIRDDKSARVTVFVDANNNGRLDLQGNFREAYRTFAVQLDVRPEFKLEMREKTVDLGLLWHGFDSPLYSQIFGQPSAGVTAADQAFYRQYWKPFTLVNTGNVNLPAIKPEVIIQRPATPTVPEMVNLSSDSVDSLRSLTLVRNPTDPGADLRLPGNIYLRTTLDGLLAPPNGVYDSGPGAWLQKARAGASAPSTNVFAGDPSPPPTAGGQGAAVLEPFLSMNIPFGTPLGTYAGLVRFFNDQNVQMQLDPTGFPGFRYVVAGQTGDGLLNRLGAAEIPQEPFTDPTFTLKLRVTENLAAGSVTNPAVAGGVTTTLSRTMPAAGFNRLDLQDPARANFPDRNPLMLFYSSNQAGLSAQAPDPLRFDLFGAGLALDPTLGVYPFDRTPQTPDPWVALGNGALSGTPNRPGTIKNTKPFYLQDDWSPPGGPRQGYLFWDQEASSQPGLTDAILMYRQITPTVGDPQVLTPGGSQQPTGSIARRMSPRAVLTDPVTGTRPNWLLMWHGGDATKRNIFYSQTTTPDNPASWGAEKVLATSSSLASVGDPSPTYSHTTKTTWLFYTGFSQRLGRSDIYLTKYNDKTLGNPNQFFGLLGFAPMMGDILAANSSRTVYTAGGIDWNVDANHPVQVYLDNVPLIEPGDPGTKATNGEMVYEVRNTPNLTGLRDNNVRVIVDPAGGIVRFSMDTRRMRTLITGLTPVGPAPPPDPLIGADYTPGTLRVTRSDAGSSGPVGILTTTMEPSWLGEVLDLQAQRASWDLSKPRPESRPVAARGDRLWVFWRRGAGAVGGGPALYFKTLRPSIKVQRGRFTDLNITVTSRPDLVKGSKGDKTQIFPQDIDMSEGALYFREEDEGLVALHGVPVPVEVTYTDPLTNTQRTELSSINWREEIGETPVPVDVSVNEGSLSVFPVYEKTLMLPSPSATGSPLIVDHVQKMWLFWSSTRGSGNDIFQATLAPRFKQDAQILDPNFGLTLIRGKR